MSNDLAGVMAGPASLQLSSLKSRQADSQRTAKAAREFEGLLLASWLQSVEEGLRALAGDSGATGADTMGALGVQAVAKGVAEGGGIGLARMLLKHLPVAGAPTGEPVRQTGSREPGPSPETAPGSEKNLRFP